MKERIWQLVLLAVVLIGVFLVFGLDITDLDDLWGTLEAFWNWIKGFFDMDPSSVPDLPIPNVPKPRFML